MHLMNSSTASPADVTNLFTQKLDNIKTSIADASLAPKKVKKTTPSLATSAPPIPTPPPPATVPAVLAPKIVKKKALPPLPSVGDLSPHVAKQLLELSRIRKAECPIIAEELTEGNTAAMPCGHLFSRLGIEESFKKEPRKCPACRAAGNPTLV
jgi:hypothetical protein